MKTSKAAPDKLAWLWLLAGFLLLPLTAWHTVVPLAAWLALPFLLRFARTFSRPRLVPLLVFIAYAAGIFLAARAWQLDRITFIIVVIVMPLTRGLLCTLPYLADRRIGSRLGAWGRVLVFPAAYTLVDWFMSLLKPVTTAGSIAYSQYGNLALVQIVSVTGMWGLTFLIAWFASTVNELWEGGFDLRAARPRLGLYAGVLAATLLFGGLRLAFAGPASQTIETAAVTIDPAVIQAASGPIDWLTFNQSSDAQRAAARPKFAATVDQMLQRTETALKAGAKLVVWQEFSAIALEEDRQSVIDRASALARQYGAALEITLWTAPRSSSLPYAHNQAILIDHNGRVGWTYDKSYPVVPGEGSVAVAGDRVLPVAADQGSRLSTAICNDLHYPALLRQAGQNGVDILLAPFDDMPSVNTQDYAGAAFRAVENGFSLARAAGNGVSTLVDTRGRQLASLEYGAGSDGILLGALPARGVVTFYSRTGDWLVALCLAGLAWMAVRALFLRRQPLPAAQGQMI